jgi:hypothetical protein
LLSTRYAHTLCFKQTGEIDNLIVSWEQSIWLCYVQVPRCSWQSKALDEAPYKLSGAVMKLASITFWSLAFSWIRLNLGFLLREKLAAVLIIPSSWGSQLDGDLHQHTVPHQDIFLAPLPGKKKTSAREVSHAHHLLCFKFTLLYFYLFCFIKNIKKSVSFIVVISLLLVHYVVP